MMKRSIKNWFLQKFKFIREEKFKLKFTEFWKLSAFKFKFIYEFNDLKIH